MIRNCEFLPVNGENSLTDKEQTWSDRDIILQADAEITINWTCDQRESLKKKELKGDVCLQIEKHSRNLWYTLWGKRVSRI